MKIHTVEQGTAEWLGLRAGIATASELDQILTPKLALRDGKTVDTYIARKLAERWIGFPLPSYSGGAMEQGQLSEPDARSWYAAMYDADIQEVGFITTDAGDFGCSPDGLIGDGLGIEIKCPQAPNHVKWLLAGVVPEEHFLQCQGSMYATGFKRWKFLSYHRGFPPLVVTVERDSKAIDAITTAIESFNARIQGGMDRITKINGGPPRRDFNTSIKDGAITHTLKGVSL